MDNQDSKPSIVSRLRRLLKYLSLDWILLVFDLAREIGSIFCAVPSGPYEILDYEVAVELLDTTGKTARLTKRVRVKFLQNGVIAFEDYVWGDGDVLIKYKCTPGAVVDRYKDGDRWIILISLRNTKSVGDVEQFHIEQEARNTYLKDEEWLQTEIRHHTYHVKMSVIFPRGRFCKHSMLIQRSANRTTDLGPDHFDTLPDGRQLISWETDRARPYEVYTLKWLW